MTSRRTQLGYVVLGLLIAGVGLAFGGPLSGVDEPFSQPGVDAGTTETASGATTSDVVGTSDPVSTSTSTASPAGDDGTQPTTSPTGNGAIVTVYSPNGTELGTIHAMVADEPNEWYTGLSDTEALAEDEGMVFVFPSESTHAFVMRDMDFPLDMIFVGADGRINEIHHAPVEDDSDLTQYRGSAKWVIEVNRGWTTAHNVSVGDRIAIER